MGRGKSKYSSKAKQISITQMARPLIKVNSVIGEQIAVAGSFCER